jgi:hypothetical protein
VHMIDQKCKDNQRIEDVQLQMLTELQILAKLENKVIKSGRHTAPPIMLNDTSPGFVASQWIPNSFEGGAHHIEPSKLLQRAMDENPYRVLEDESSSATPNLASIMPNLTRVTPISPHRQLSLPTAPTKCQRTYAIFSTH